MLDVIFGSQSAAGVLGYLSSRTEGSATEIARYLGIKLYSVQQQLAKFERIGLVQKRAAGRGRALLYAFNSLHPLAGELQALLQKAGEIANAPQPKTNPLPDHLRSVFWDYPFEQLNWEVDRDLVIRRVLSQGSWQAVQWLRKQLGDPALRRWLIDHRGRGLSPRQIRFWSLLLSLPRQQADRWIYDRSLHPLVQ